MQDSLAVLIEFALTRQSVSVAEIQRRFGVGHPQAVAYAFRIERLGFVGSPNHRGERLTKDRTRRLLFLDFDGVLHVGADRPFRRAAILAEALGCACCSIVISSSWRTGRSVSELSALLPPALGNRIVAHTGDALAGKYQRQQEIEAFLADEPERPDWRALDDSTIEFVDRARLISCDPRTGFSDAQAKAISSWLAQDTGQAFLQK
jgi:hypothetical protein